MRVNGRDPDPPVAPGWKRCGNPECRRVKPTGEGGGFWRNRNNKDGYQHYCNTCQKAKNANYREGDDYKEHRRRYNRTEARQQALRGRVGTPRYEAYQKAYRRTERGKLLAAARRARWLAGNHKDRAARAAWARTAKLYKGCVAALDPADGKPVPKGCKRCPACMTPKPLKRNFYVDRSKPDGHEDLCRCCNYQGEHVRRPLRERAARGTSVHKFKDALYRALRRLALGGQTPHGRASTERTAAAARAELARRGVEYRTKWDTPRRAADAS